MRRSVEGEPKGPSGGAKPIAADSRSTTVRSTWAVPLVMVALLLLLAAPQLDQYNVTWDEALGDLFWGERYLSFFTSFDPDFLDPEIDPYPRDHRPDLRSSAFRDRPWEYYPFANLLAAATSKVLFAGLGVLDPFDGFHAVNLGLASLLIVALYRFVRPRWGATAALLAPALLLLAPRSVCHMMANVKDFPEMVLFSLALLAFHRAWERGGAGRMIGAGAIWGLALATKANALFLPGVVLAVALWARVPERFRGRRDRRLWLSLVLWGVVGGTVMVALWPWLWPSPVSRFLLHLDYVSGQVFQVREESLLSPLRAILTTTPPSSLALALVGMVPLMRQAWLRRAESVLVVAWLAVVLARLYLPGAVNFDGVRHFLELFPALMIAAGVGAQGLTEGLGRAFGDKVARGTVTVVAATALLASAWPTVTTHPHQIAYWNVLAGGTAGAYARAIPQAGDYWGMSYRQGIEWLNEHAEPGAVVAVPVVQHAVVLVAPERLRSDLGIAPVTVPNFPQLAPGAMEFLDSVTLERPVYVMFVLREDWMNQLMRDCMERLEPSAQWELDGVPLLQIYRYLPSDAAL